MSVGSDFVFPKYTEADELAGRLDRATLWRFFLGLVSQLYGSPRILDSSCGSFGESPPPNNGPGGWNPGRETTQRVRRARVAVLVFEPAPLERFFGRRALVFVA